MPKEEIQNIEKLHRLKEFQLSMKRLGIPYDKYKPLEENNFENQHPKPSLT